MSDDRILEAVKYARSVIRDEARTTLQKISTLLCVSLPESWLYEWAGRALERAVRQTFLSDGAVLRAIELMLDGERPALSAEQFASIRKAVAHPIAAAVERMAHGAYQPVGSAGNTFRALAYAEAASAVWNRSGMTHPEERLSQLHDIEAIVEREEKRLAQGEVPMGIEQSAYILRHLVHKHGAAEVIKAVVDLGMPATEQSQEEVRKSIGVTVDSDAAPVAAVPSVAESVREEAQKLREAELQRAWGVLTLGGWELRGDESGRILEKDGLRFATVEQGFDAVLDLASQRVRHFRSVMNTINPLTATETEGGDFMRPTISNYDSHLAEIDAWNAAEQVFSSAKWYHERMTKR